MIANSQLITPPVLLPVALTTVKRFLRVDENSEDDLITDMILTATTVLENYLDLKFVNQTWDIYFDNYPCNSSVQEPWWDGVREGAETFYFPYSSKLSLPFGRLQSAEVSTTDDSNTTTVFDPTGYTVDTVNHYGQIVLNKNISWPTTPLAAVNGLKVRGVFGFGEGYNPTGPVPSAVPNDIQNAIRNLVAVLYENRGDELPTVPPQVAMMVERYRRNKL